VEKQHYPQWEAADLLSCKGNTWEFVQQTVSYTIMKCESGLFFNEPHPVYSLCRWKILSPHFTSEFIKSNYNWIYSVQEKQTITLNCSTMALHSLSTKHWKTETHAICHILFVLPEMTNFTTYRKPTSTDIIVHNCSCHPKEYKFASTNYLTNQLYSYLISKQAEDTELRIIKIILKINQHKHTHLHKTTRTKDPKETNTTTNGPHLHIQVMK
jgi:hypothetical protein